MRNPRLGGRGRKNKRTKYEDITPGQPLNIFAGPSILESSLSYCPLCPISVAALLEPGKTDPSTDREAPLTSALLHRPPPQPVPRTFIPGFLSLVCLSSYVAYFDGTSFQLSWVTP